MTNRRKQRKDLSAKVLNQLYWEERNSLSQIGKKYGINASSVLKKMRKYGIKTRSLSDSGYLFHAEKPCFNVKKSLDCNEKNLLIAGIMLYWAEGTLKRDTVDFANSNPEMIKVFLSFLRKICGIDESRLRAYVYAFSDQNINEIKSFWEKTTGIPKSQFVKPYIRVVRNFARRNRRMENGLIKIRYSDKKLLCIINSWIEQYKQVFI